MAKAKTIPETIALESVIENATETTGVATENLREIAQVGARKASEGYEQLAKAVQEASEHLTARFAEAREGAAQTSLKLLEVAKEDTDATYVAMREMFGAKSLVEALDVSAKYWRGRLEARVAHMHDLGAHMQKVTEDAVRPMREGIEKLTRIQA